MNRDERSEYGCVIYPRELNVLGLRRRDTYFVLVGEERFILAWGFWIFNCGHFDLQFTGVKKTYVFSLLSGKTLASVKTDEIMSFNGQIP